MKNTLLFLSFLLIFNISGQTKKILDHADFDHWNKIKDAQISNDGKWVLYQLKPGYGDPTLKIIYKITAFVNIYSFSNT